MRAWAGTLIPAIAARACGVCPTDLGFIAPPALNRIAASLAWSSLAIQWAPLASMCARNCAAIGRSATTDCSVAQMTEQSKALLLTIAAAAAGMSALRSTYAGTLPGPTPRAGLPVLCAARTIGVPPVARIIDVA